MKLGYTKAQIALEYLSALLLLGMFTFLLVSWSSIPEQIPTHFDAAGIANAWGSRRSILVLPVISLLLGGLMTAISFSPGLWNMPGKAKGGYSAAAYVTVKTMLIAMKAEMLALFGYIVVCQARSLPLGSIFIYITLGALALTIAVPLILIMTKQR